MSDAEKKSLEESVAHFNTGPNEENRVQWQEAEDQVREEFESYFGEEDSIAKVYSMFFPGRITTFNDDYGYTSNTYKDGVKVADTETPHEDLDL